MELCFKGELHLRLLLADLSDAEALRRALQGRQTDGRGAWLASCANGHLACARRLHAAAQGAEISVAQEHDRTERKALMLAARAGHVDDAWPSFSEGTA